MFKLLLRSVALHQLGKKCPTYQCLKRLSSKTFTTPRPPKDPPDDGYKPESIDHEDLEPGDFVRPEAYRQFQAPNEVLGPGAGVSKAYKNPHYFGYHRFSYVELQNQSLELRDERRLSGGVQAKMGEDEEDECPDDSIEAMQAQEAECDEALKAQMKDGEKNKLKSWCTAVEKKQKEIREVKKCEDIEKKKLQEKEKNKIAKGTKKIVEECVQKLETSGECKEEVIKETLAELESESTDKEKKDVKCADSKEEKISKKNVGKKSNECEKTDKNDKK